MTARRALLLVNRRARKGAEKAPAAVARLRELGLELVEEDAAGAAPLAELARRHRGLDLVIVGGGDGTLSHALDGLVATGLPLGVLPLGTANNLARTLGIPADPLEACEVIAAGHRHRIDLGRVNERHFFTTASFGLSVAITEQLTGGAKRRWGVLAYAATAARVLARARPFIAEISWPGGHRRSRTVQVVVGNGRHYGSALLVADDARIDDQQLDLYSLEIVHWWQLLRLLPALKRGTHGEHETVHALRAKEFTVLTPAPHPIDVDGELGPSTPARFRVVPRALEVFVPLPK
jgi:diacylglycerol kinase (ATP)